MKILAVNAGSSSMKFQLFDMPSETVLTSANFERIGLENSFYSIKINGEKIKKEARLNNHGDAVRLFFQEIVTLKIVSAIDEIESVGHRVLHGFDKYSKPVIVDNQVMEDIDLFSALGPLHNPANLLGIKAIKEILPKSLNVAVFDTAFHQAMNEEAYIYPVPYEWYTKHGVRRYGFHGTSHHYISDRIASILGTNSFKAIVCHLGNGASITAVKDGKCVETSMGLTPISGIPMGTRCGDIDPSIIEYMMKQTGKSIDDIMNDLNKKSGVLGMSGISSDSRDIETAMENGDKQATLSRAIYVRRIISFISFYYVLLGGVDVIAFTAGIGENSPWTRKDIMDSLGVLGVKLDEAANDVKGVERLISTTDSKIKCYIIPTNEELMIARETYNFAR